MTEMTIAKAPGGAEDMKPPERKLCGCVDNLVCLYMPGDEEDAFGECVYAFKVSAVEDLHLDIKVRYVHGSLEAHNLLPSATEPAGKAPWALVGDVVLTFSMSKTSENKTPCVSHKGLKRLVTVAYTLTATELTPSAGIFKSVPNLIILRSPATPYVPSAPYITVGPVVTTSDHTSSPEYVYSGPELIYRGGHGLFSSAEEYAASEMEFKKSILKEKARLRKKGVLP